jgi:hypothetical protein
MTVKGYVRAVDKWRGVKPEHRKKVVRLLRATALAIPALDERDAALSAAAVLEQGRARDFGEDAPPEEGVRALAVAVAEDAMRERIGEILRSDTPWPLQDVVVRLVQAAEHLLDWYGSDVHGYEEIRAAVIAAKGILRAFGITEVAKINDELAGASRVVRDFVIPHAEDFGRNPFAMQAISSAVAIPTSDDALRIIEEQSKKDRSDG